ncbi:hypothetical protein L1887_19836 [Cichorium endivia]|nr:hypothetical protein L1887_19836 [Cichorium endivia]
MQSSHASNDQYLSPTTRSSPITSTLPHCPLFPSLPISPPLPETTPEPTQEPTINFTHLLFLITTRQKPTQIPFRKVPIFMFKQPTGVPRYDSECRWWCRSPETKM